MPDKFSALAGLVLRPILRSCPTSRRFCVCGGGGGGGVGEGEGKLCCFLFVFSSLVRNIK